MSARHHRWLLLCPLLLVSSACLQRQVFRGELKSLIEADAERVHQVTLDLLRGSELAVEQETCTADQSVIQARYADGLPVTIETRPLANDYSNITILVGDLGDRAKARELLDRIRRKVEGDRKK